MSIVVQCPKCQSRLKAPNEIAGKSVRCKSCREKFQVPAFSLPSTPGRAGPVAVETSTPLPKNLDGSVFVPAPLTPSAVNPEPEPLPLDELALEEVPNAPPALAIPAQPVQESLSPEDLQEVAVGPTGTKETFSFEEPSPAKKKKRRREEDDDDEDDKPVKPERKARAGRDSSEPVKAGRPWKIIIGVGALVLVLGVGAVVLLLNNGKKEIVETKTPSPPAQGGQGKLKILSKVKEPTNPPENGGNTNNPESPGKTGTGTTTPTGPKPQPEAPPPGGPVAPPKEPPPAPPVPPQPPLVETTLPAAPTGPLKIAGKIKHKIPLAIPLDKIRNIQIGNDSVVVAFNSLPSFQGAGGKDTIRLYGLATGVKGREFVLDSLPANWTAAYAVSASDGLVAIETGGPGKVSVYDFETGSFVLEKQDVFAGITGRVGPIAALAIGANRKLFVVDQSGAVDLWDLSTRQRIVTGTPPRRSGRSSPKACMMKNGTILALAIDARVWAIDAAGTPLEKPVTLADAGATPLAIGSSAAPDRLALAYQTPDGKVTVAAVRLQEGGVQFQALIPKAAGPVTQVSWPADTILSVSTSGGEAGMLIDLEAKTSTGYVKPLTGKANIFPLTNEFWWVMPDPKDARSSLLLSVEMPFDGYFELAKQAKESKTPVYLVPQVDGLAR